MRLHLGCGNDIRPGWCNLDLHGRQGVDVVANLEGCDRQQLPFEDGTVEEIDASHLIEHITRPLPLLAELWRIAQPDAVATFSCPYGSSDSAWEDPTHVRPYFAGSWAAFSQPYYWRVSAAGDNGYGYAGDWQPETVTLRIRPWAREITEDPDELMAMVRAHRNVVDSMTAVLRAVKPARPTDRALLKPPSLTFTA